MKLSKILSAVKSEFQISSGLGAVDQIEIEDIAIDSRLVKKNSVFFALQGKATDGSKFIEDAVKNGAAAVVGCQLPVDGFHLKSVAQITSFDAFQLLVEFLKIFYAPLPANIYAITGTNGKTSTAEFSRQILQFLGKKSASVGTLGVRCDAVSSDLLHDSSLTTPDIVSLYKNLQILKKNGVDDVSIEVSSIGLDQGRVAGLEIEVGAFTNFTQDHLDYHQSMENYFACKMLLFACVLQPQGFAVINSDIEQFQKIKEVCDERKISIIDYGFKARQLRLERIEQNALGQKVFFNFGEKKYHFELSTSGDFQAFNALCALGNVLTKNSLSEAQLKNLLEKFSALNPAPGRMQRVVALPNNAQVFIDFAHSPDALANVLKLARGLTKSRVIVLFGCGGNRDPKKRSIMGRLACELANLVIVTDDNPRKEAPEAIRQEILAACDMKKTLEISDRKTAIEKALTLVEAGDILILAGKGHEKYQIIGEKKFEFDEEKIVKNAVGKAS